MLGMLQSKIEYFDWQPTLSFATNGDLAVTYTTRLGTGWRCGSIVGLEFFVVTSGFTHTTAAGNLQLTGAPYAATNSNTRAIGALQYGGITKATTPSVVCKLSGANAIVIFAGSGSGVASANISAADTPTGGTMTLLGSIIYRIN